MLGEREREGGGEKGRGGERERGGGDTVEGMLICPSQGHKLLLYSHSDYTHWCWERERERGGGEKGRGGERERGGGDTVEGMLICPSQGHKLLLYSHSDYTHWCWERERERGGGGEGERG